MGLGLAEAVAKRACIEKQSIPPDKIICVNSSKDTRFENNSDCFTERARASRPGRLDLTPDPDWTKCSRDLDRRSSVNIGAELKIVLDESCRARQPERVALDVNDSQRFQTSYLFNGAQLRLNGRSWDELDPSSIEPEPSRVFDFDPSSKQIIMNAAINGALGFDSELAQWSDQIQQFELHPAVMKTSFASYLEHFAHIGSLIRRLRGVVLKIQNLSPEFERRTILAIASAIDREIKRLQLQGKSIYRAKNLIELAVLCDERGSEVQNLAELIGCAGERGKLARLPTATDLMQRAYTRAHQLDSDMLWRISLSCLTPWIEQLNFVLGLKDTLVIRTPSFSLKVAYFPELFIDFAEETSAAFLIEDQIPKFLPHALAQLTLDCYTFLCYLGMKGIAAVKRSGSTKLPPIKSGFIRGTLDGFTAKRHTSISDSLRDDSINEVPPQSMCTHRPTSVKNEIRQKMRVIYHRSLELDAQVKAEFLDEFTEFQNIILGLFFLQDGVLLSRLGDLLDTLWRDTDVKFHSRLTDMNDLIMPRYNVRVSANPRQPGCLQIEYHPADMISIFGIRLLNKCQRVFNRIIYLRIKGLSHELALLGAELDEVSRKIREALQSGAGVASLKAAYDAVPPI